MYFTMQIGDYRKEGLTCLYTTRRIDDAIKFIEMLPFSEEDRIELKSYLPVVDEFFGEVSSKTKLESYTLMRVIDQLMDNEVGDFVGFIHKIKGGDVEIALVVMRLQARHIEHYLNFGKKHGLSNSTLKKIEEYLGYLQHLYMKYSKEFQEDE